jgi:predicted kinase
LASHRAAFRDGYGFAGPAPAYVECRAPVAAIAERARRRELEPGHSSDATEAIAVSQLAELEPLDEVEPDRHVAVRTDRELRDLVDEVEAALDARLARGMAP